MILDVLQANISTVLVFLVFFLITRILLRRKTNLPPGPWPMPLLGNLTTLGGGDPWVVQENLREKYGDIYTVYLGQNSTVFVHGYENVKEILVTRGEDFLDRNSSFRILDDDIGRGKRNCLGESLAKMELFLFFTAIVQRFELRLPDGAEADLTPVIGITRTPRPYKFIAKPRH